MALLFADGFDAYPNASAFPFKWDGAAPVGPANMVWEAAGGRFGGGAYHATATNTVTLLEKIWGTPTLSPRFGFWLRWDNVPNATAAVLRLLAATTTHFCELRMVSTGTLQITRYDTSAPTSYTTPLAYNDGLWHWVEVDYFLSSTATGYIRLRVDGELVIDYSGISSIATGVTNPPVRVQFGKNGGTARLWLDDLVVWNDEGTSFNTFPLGPRRIRTQLPVSDGETNDFAAMGGAPSRWQGVSKVWPYGDDGYVQSDVPGARQLFNYASLPVIPQDIAGVILNNYVRNPDLGTINFQHAAKSGANVVLGGSQEAPMTYRHRQMPMGLAPDGTPWTRQKLIDTQFGLEVV